MTRHPLGEPLNLSQSSARDLRPHSRSEPRSETRHSKRSAQQKKAGVSSARQDNVLNPGQTQESSLAANDLEALGRGFPRQYFEDDAQSVASSSSCKSRLSQVSVKLTPHAFQRSQERIVSDMEIQLAKKFGGLLISIECRTSARHRAQQLRLWGEQLCKRFQKISISEPIAPEKRVEMRLDGSEGLGPKVKKWLIKEGFFAHWSRRLCFIHESATGDELVVVEGRKDDSQEIGLITTMRKPGSSGGSHGGKNTTGEYKRFWEALARDDATALRGLLEQAGGGKDVASVMLQLELDLWNRGAGHGPLKSKRFGLIPLAAGHRHTPNDGALQCLEMLLASADSAWTEQQLDLALSMARKRDRRQAMLRLKLVIQGSPTSLSARLPSRLGDDDWDDIVALLTRDDEIARISGLDARLKPCLDGNGTRGLFDGRVVDGKPLGPGILTLLSGERVVGTFNADGFPCGSVQRTHRDGVTTAYTGEHNEKGREHGRGLRCSALGRPLQDGWWEDGWFSLEASITDEPAQGPVWLALHAERQFDAEPESMIMRPRAQWYMKANASKEGTEEEREPANAVEAVRRMLRQMGGASPEEELIAALEWSVRCEIEGEGGAVGAFWEANAGRFAVGEGAHRWVRLREVALPDQRLQRTPTPTPPAGDDGGGSEQVEGREREASGSAGSAGSEGPASLAPTVLQGAAMPEEASDDESGDSDPAEHTPSPGAARAQPPHTRPANVSEAFSPSGWHVKERLAPISERERVHAGPSTRGSAGPSTRGSAEDDGGPREAGRHSAMRLGAAGGGGGVAGAGGARRERRARGAGLSRNGTRGLFGGRVVDGKPLGPGTQTLPVQGSLADWPALNEKRRFDAEPEAMIFAPRAPWHSQAKERKQGIEEEREPADAAARGSLRENKEYGMHPCRQTTWCRRSR